MPFWRFTKAAGVRFGRKRQLSDYQCAEAIRRRATGETLAAIAKSAAVAGVVNTLPTVCRTFRIADSGLVSRGLADACGKTTISIVAHGSSTIATTVCGSGLGNFVHETCYNSLS